MSESNYKKALFDVLLEECEAMIPNIYEDHVFSARFERKMKRLISRHKKPYYPLISTGARRAACIVVALIVFSASALSVKAVRDAVYDFIMRIFSDHTEVEADIDLDGEYPKTIEEEYYISDLPEGFELVDYYSDIYSVYSAYFHNDEYVFFEQYTKDNYISNYDNNYTEQDKIEIDGQEYIIFYIYNDNQYIFLWDNSKYIFILKSNFNKDDIVNLCKSTKIK